MRVLCADLGNSRTHLAVFPPGRAVARIPARCDAAVYASVAPSREAAFEREIRRRGLRPIKLGRDLPIPARVRSGRAWKPGADRLCNALAAHARVRGSCVVVDLGTAVTVEAVSRDGELIGGLIAPGLGTMAAALMERTELIALGETATRGRLDVAGSRARSCRLHAPASLQGGRDQGVRHLLPRIDDGAIGRTTRENVQAGLWFSIRGMVDAARRWAGRGAPLVGTGGDAPRFARWFDLVDPLLTLRGVFLSFALHLVKRGPEIRLR
jgi:pantothenate kinase type III